MDKFNFETLEELLKFQDANREVYEVAFGSDRAILYRRGEGIPLATVYDERCGAIAAELLKILESRGDSDIIQGESSGDSP